ncbi:MAG TPA: sensor domain-containing diguanylate cyclase [Rugosimonospora sp.]|nr:sensor domain-containing diguanylate cyclase [Rugosimonospora sp.]
MSERRASRDSDILVPIGDRIRYLQLFRFAMVAVAAGYWLALPAYRALPGAWLAGLTAAYLGLSLLGSPVLRLRRKAGLAYSGFLLLADGVYLAAVAYSPGGLLTPFRYIVVLHLITVTLLASFRTGLKLAMWHTLLLWLDQELRGGILPALPPHAGAGTQVALFTAVLWLAAVTTASFGAVNERELRRHGYDMRALARLGWRLEQAALPHEVAGTFIDALADDFTLERIALIEVDGGRAAPLACRGVGLSPDGTGTPFSPAGDALIAQVLRDGATLLVATADPVRDPWLAWAFPGARNVGLVPLRADGRGIGVLCFEYGLRRGSRIEQRTLAMIERFASHASLALLNAALLRQVYELASTDGLTGAANRRTFDERLELECGRAQDGASLTLLMLDVDHFKQVNDKHGHAAGDEVLRQVVGHIRRTCRARDLVARYGGEEFAILLPDTGPDAARQLGERIRLAIADARDAVPVTVSLGMATWEPPVRGPQELVEVADQALYHSKLTGRNRLTIGPVVSSSAGSAA